MVTQEIEKALLAVNRLIAEYHGYALQGLDEEVQLDYLQQAGEAPEQFLHVIKTCSTPKQKAHTGK